MATAFRPRTLVLFLGDIFFFAFALWLALAVRSFAFPSWDVFLDHLLPFCALFAAWVVAFFIAGLYESRSIILARRALSVTLLVTQTFNISLAALFFFFIPLFGIAPKTILFIYLLTSFPLILLWRTVLYPWLGLQKPEQAVAVGSRAELLELVDALRRAPRAPARVATVLDPGSPSIIEDIKYAVAEHRARFIIADFSDPRVLRGFPDMYNFLAAGIRFFDATALYEEVFGRVPLSVVDERWLARNVSRHAQSWYDALKRLMDITIAVIGGILSLIFYPFIIAAIKLDEGTDSAIISMPRVGEGGKVFNFYKFRTMSGNDNADYGKAGTTTLRVTSVGRILRVSRLDELPQFWNVLRGDVSLIGPRPESPSLVAEYDKEIPYYTMRHLIKPGISGWAQLYGEHGHHGVELDTTRNKLSYDLYYLKYRSLTLDIVIALKTIKKLLTRSGV